MVWFLQKREILEYCGKDWKAVRWLDNQIRDGLIIHDADRGYIKVWEYWQEAYDEAKRRFNEKLEKVEREKAELEKRLAGVDIDKIEEYKENCKYWEDEAKRYAQYCADIVDICYRKVKASLWSKMTESSEEFKEWIQRMVKWED